MPLGNICDADLLGALEASHALAFEWDIVNDRVRRLHSHEPAFPETPELANSFAGVLAVVHPDDRASFQAAVQSALQRPDGAYASKHRIVRADGQVRMLSESGRVRFDAAGRPLSLSGIAHDISEQLVAEQALKTRNSQLELLASTAQRLLAARGAQTELVRSIGADIARLIGMSAFYHYRVGGQPRLLTLAAHGGISEAEQHLFSQMRFGELLCGRVAETQQRLIVEDLQHCDYPGSDALRATGATSYAGFPLMRNGQLIGTLAFVSHVRTHLRDGEVQTIQAVCNQLAAALDRARLEDEIRAGEERARLALEGGDLGSWDVELATGQATWNRRHAQLQGYGDAGSYSVDRWQALVHPDDLDGVLGAMQRARMAGTPFTVEHRVRRADNGETRWLALYGRYFYDGDGRAVRVSGVSRDITEQRHAEQAQLQFVRLADEATDFIGMATPDGRSVYVNPAGRALVGLDEAQVERTHMLDLVPEQDRTGFTSMVLARLRSQGAWEGETRFRHFKTGEPIDVLQKVFPIRDLKSGVPIRFATIAVDIRERKKVAAALATSEARFRQLADQTPIVMWVTDAHGRIEFVNQAYCNFFGVTLAEASGLDWQPLVHPHDRAYIDEFLNALATQSRFNATARVRRADGAWRWIASVGQPRFDPTNAFIGMIGVSPDITDQHHAAELEREAARQKDEFIAVLAHELRNPLAPIRASVGVLRAIGPKDDKLAKCRDIIDRQVAHMARLLDDLLDVSRLSRGKLSLQTAPVRLRDVVGDAVETVRPLLHERGHALTVTGLDEEIELDADAARLTQVLVNLLNNAAKYTDRQGTIELSIERNETSVVIRVRDNGIGLRPEMQDRIFELFTQADDGQHRAEGGLGIGLGLTKRLVELHGGTIDAVSPGLGRGTTFTATLPISRRAPAARAPRQCVQAPHAPANRRRVLIVDDNEDAADTLALLLDTFGCDTRTAYDGADALALAPEFKPELILLDLGMPGLDGAAVCERLRAQRWAAETVIAAVTGWGQDGDRSRTKASGFDHHIVKPVDSQTLLELVRALH